MSKVVELCLLDALLLRPLPGWLLDGSGRPFQAPASPLGDFGVRAPDQRTSGPRTSPLARQWQAPPQEVMLRELDAQLQKGDNPGARTCVVVGDAAELFGTRGLVKIRGAIDAQPFHGALMAQGDDTHRLPVKATLRKAIGTEANDTVHVRIDERVG